MPEACAGASRSAYGCAARNASRSADSTSAQRMRVCACQPSMLRDAPITHTMIALCNVVVARPVMRRANARIRRASARRRSAAALRRALPGSAPVRGVPSRQAKVFASGSLAATLAHAAGRPRARRMPNGGGLATPVEASRREERYNRQEVSR